MLNLALVGDKDGDLYPEDDASSEKDIITLQQKDIEDIDIEEEDIDEDDEDEDEDEEDDAINTEDEESSAGGGVEVGHHQPNKERTSALRSCIRSRPCTICLYMCLALFILSSVVSLIVIGVLIVAPYHRAMHFEDTVCNPIRWEEASDERRCSCGKGCNSKYPCTTVTVTLDAYNDEPAEATMYENEATLSRQCSYYPPCKSSRAANEQAVRDYERRFGSPGKKYPCLYNPDNPAEVIRTRRFHLEHVIHGMVWSSLVFLLSLAILVFAIKKKGCDFL